MARVLAAKPNDLSLIRGAHMVEGEHRPPQSMSRTEEPQEPTGSQGPSPIGQAVRSAGKETPVTEVPASGAGGSGDERCEL